MNTKRMNVDETLWKKTMNLRWLKSYRVSVSSVSTKLLSCDKINSNKNKNRLNNSKEKWFFFLMKVNGL